MAISLNSIAKGRIERPQRIILLGVEGVGKSTFAAGAPSPIFAPMAGEKGLDEIDAPKFEPCESFWEMMDVVRTLYQEEHGYRTVIFDSISAAEPLIWKAVCAEANVNSIEEVDKGYGKGYIKALNQWRELCEGLDALREERGIGSILIGHVTTKEFNDPETDPYTTYKFDVNDKAANLLYRWADAVLFANFKRAAVTAVDMGFQKKVRRAVDVGKGQRFIYTEKRPAHPGKVRAPLGVTVPYELPLDFATFEAARKGEPLKQTA